MIKMPSTSSLSLRTARIQALLHPVVYFGLVLIGLSWAAAVLKISDDAKAAQQSAIDDVKNFSLLLQQDVLRTSYSIDRVIKALRRSYERSGYSADWRILVNDEYTEQGNMVQIAVINRDGTMLTSTSNPSPITKVDLSDREHYKFHRQSTADNLYISKPVMGRASGKWSVQFTRRFNLEDGSFAGVIVVSLDPATFLSAYERLQATPDLGLAVYGADDIIRAGAGLYSAYMGRALPADNDSHSIADERDELEISSQRHDGLRRIVANRLVPSMPLSVVATVRDPALSSQFGWHEYHVYAMIFSLIVGLAILVSIRLQRGHVKQIELMAHHDALTKLPNRRAFQDAINNAYTSQSGIPTFALHMIDLDHFKAVNDTHGHPMGDALLCAVADRLTGAVRATDRLFRLGGDEFALIQLEQGDARGAEAVAKRLCLALAQPFEISGARLHIGSSIGIASPSTELHNPTLLLQASDTALYRSKSAGRGTYSFYDRELTASIQARVRLENEMREALLTEQFEVHYQPKVSLFDANSIVGYEALVRWRHPTHGMMPPNDFISLAEDTGLIVGIGEFVLARVCSDFSTNGTLGSVAVNFSALQFSRSDVVQVVAHALAQSGLPPHRLEIEITESSLMSDDTHILVQLEKLRAMGIRISLDDFGTGYSSLSYLDKYPIDCIKIDRSFVAKLGAEPRAAGICRAIISLAYDLQMIVVAEGVETNAQADLLRSLGCQVAQGYLFGKPRPASEQWDAPTITTACAA
jgi:diguanylate cyclase (GGDEF)-like protein